MYRGTTPILPLRIKGIDLTEAKVYVTVTDRVTGKSITYQSGTDFTPEYDGTRTICDIRMSQEDTLQLSVGLCEAQARYIFQDGLTGATKRAPFRVKDVLLDGVIAYDE